MRCSVSSVPAHDVVVLGTGAAGLVAALAAHDVGASVGLYEKGDVVGGTTALSGGILWVPNNPQAAAAGISDSGADALAYLDSLSLGMIDPTLVGALIDTGPEVLDWLAETTPLRLQLVSGFPDYHPDHPGAKSHGGRSLDPDLFAFEALGPWAARVACPPNVPRLNLLEIPIGGGSGSIEQPLLDDRVAHDVRGRGQALVGALLQACLDRGIEPLTGARAEDLVVDDGRVSGVRFESGDEVAADRGVVVATGGFEWDRDLVQAFLRGPMTSSNLDPDQHRRRPAHGDACWGRARCDVRGVVGAGDRDPGRGAVRASARSPDPAGTIPAGFDHGEPARPPLRQRSHELQRVGRCFPPVRSKPLRVRQPALLADLRSRPSAQVRVRHGGTG